MRGIGKECGESLISGEMLLSKVLFSCANFFLKDIYLCGVLCKEGT